MLETLYNLAEKNNADISVCSSRKVDDEGNITETRNPNSPLNLNLIPVNKIFNYKDFPNDIFNLTGTAPWNKLYSRKMIVENNLTIRPDFGKYTTRTYDSTCIYGDNNKIEKILKLKSLNNLNNN